MRTWKFIKDSYEKIDDEIRDIGNDFFRGLTFVFLWVFILTILGCIVLMSIYKPKIIMGLAILIGVFELLCYFGKKLER